MRSGRSKGSEHEAYSRLSIGILGEYPTIVGLTGSRTALKDPCRCPDSVRTFLQLPLGKPIPFTSYVKWPIPRIICTIFL